MRDPKRKEIAKEQKQEEEYATEIPKQT